MSRAAERLRRARAGEEIDTPTIGDLPPGIAQLAKHIVAAQRGVRPGDLIYMSDIISPSNIVTGVDIAKHAIVTDNIANSGIGEGKVGSMTKLVSTSLTDEALQEAPMSQWELEEERLYDDDLDNSYMSLFRDDDDPGDDPGGDAGMFDEDLVDLFEVDSEQDPANDKLDYLLSTI